MVSWIIIYCIYTTNIIVKTEQINCSTNETINYHARQVIVSLIILLQADRGCAAVASFWGGKGAFWQKGCYAPRATDFREERNPPQAYCKCINLSSSWLLSCNTPLSRVGYLFFLSSCWILTSFPLISSILYPTQCSRIAMMIHFIISILYVPQ